MKWVRRHPWLGALMLMFLVLVIFVGSFGMYLAGQAGRLPWQEDPTRIPITPFADIPGFGDATEAPAEPAGTASPAAESTPPSETTSVNGTRSIILNGSRTADARIASARIVLTGSAFGGAAWPR